MVTINYNGMELEEVTTPQIFDPPKMCVVWDDEPEPYCVLPVSAIGRIKRGLRTLSDEGTTWRHCALLPDPPKPRRPTRRELSKWLAQGNGEMKLGSSKEPTTDMWRYTENRENEDIGEGVVVRKWEDTEWHEPTVEYMGLEE